MRYYSYVLRRYCYTAICKVAAAAAKRFRFFWLASVLAWALNKRDMILCIEAKYCMSNTVKWQRKAQKCIAAHTEYENEVGGKK